MPIILDFFVVWSNPLSPLGPCCATKKDIAPENPDTRVVSGFFRALILGCKQEGIFLCPEDLNYRPPRFQAAFERCILPKAAFFVDKIAFLSFWCYNDWADGTKTDLYRWTTIGKRVCKFPFAHIVWI